MSVNVQVVYRQKLYKFLYEQVCDLLRKTIVEGLQALDDDKLFFIPPDFTVTVTKGTKRTKNIEIICELRFSIVHPNPKLTLLKPTTDDFRLLKQRAESEKKKP